MDAIQQRLLENVDGVLAVHEFHVWQLAGDRIIASAHIKCRNLSEYMKIAEQVKEFFHNEGIHSTTIQPEFIDVSNLYRTYKYYVLVINTASDVFNLTFFILLYQHECIFYITIE